MLSLTKKTLFLIGSGGRSFNASACAVGTTWLLGQSLIAEMGFYMLFSTFEAVFYKSQSFTRLPKTFVICDMWSLSHSVIAIMRTINSEKHFKFTFLETWTGITKQLNIALCHLFSACIFPGNFISDDVATLFVTISLSIFINMSNF